MYIEAACLYTTNEARIVEMFGQGMFAGYIGSYLVMLSPFVSRRKRSRPLWEGEEVTCPNDFGFVELANEGYGLYVYDK